MMPDAQLLTGPTTLATCNTDLPLTAKSLISSSFMFLQVSPGTKEEDRMAAPHRRPRSNTNENELWFSMPSNRRRQDQSAYQGAIAQHHATRSAPANQPPVPTISTTVELNKPLPPSPDSQRRRQKPGLLNLIKKKPSGSLDPSHLQPEPVRLHRRSPSNDNLSPEPYLDHYQSRSMPSSPLRYSPPNSSDMQRAHSAAGHYQDMSPYQTYAPRPHVSDQQRAVSSETYFAPSPPRPRRTFPDSNTSSSATPRESYSEAPRPHTWVSPTETFGDASDFHLFAEATAGLPGGFDPLSPTEAPRLQGSLFSRGNQNDRIPVLAQNPSAQSVPVTEIPQYEWMPRQAPRDFSVSSSALPRRDSYDINASSSTRLPSTNAVNLELERLGLSESELPPDDELPDYAQSQAEMAALKRKEASARARELESRWNLSRGWKNR